MRKATGYALLALSVAAWAAIAALPFMSVSIGSAAAITTALVIGGEISFLAAVTLLGKDVWDKVKSVWKRNRGSA